MPCTTILVGKKASFDGSTIIARNDDGGFDTKQVKVIAPEKQPRKYKCKISHLELELPENPLAYTSAPNVNLEHGIWAACGINAANVAMTATETITTNPRVLGADPLVTLKPAEGKKTKEVPGGIGEEDLVVLVLPYIRSAREGVLRLGSLLEQYGTYESNGIAFSDTDEIWWMETIGGHHWIARRVPDECVVIMPNQFGTDGFDFEDAMGEGKENLCSADLKEFVNQNHLDLSTDGDFNPRLAFGSHSDSDHIYNTPRAWFMARYLMPRTYRWDGPDADFTPESDDIPWSFVPENLVTVEDVKYLLASHYQGTPYDPCNAHAELRGKYRSIGVPNSDVSILLQLRGYMPEALQAVEWISMGGSGYTACFPVYTHVDAMPKYINDTPEEVTTGYMYWDSRLIATLTDAHFVSAIIYDERYMNRVFNRGRELLCEYDKKVLEGADITVLKEANQKITDMVRKESQKTLASLLKNASNLMKTRYHRGDN